MEPAPAPSRKPRFGLATERVGPLPLINHFLERLGLGALLERHVPTGDRRRAVSHAQALGVLVRSILIEREPIYRQQETVHGFAAALFGLSGEQAVQVGDDRLGRALDQLFDADRGALLTELVVTVGKAFAVDFAELHNDSTSIRFCGRYRNAALRRGGRSAPLIVYGYSKDHRPDLKQLLFILTTSADGGVPVQFRCAAGNTSDSVTHIETWETFKTLAGRSDFLYVADSKLCSYDNLDQFRRRGGRAMLMSRVAACVMYSLGRAATDQWSSALHTVAKPTDRRSAGTRPRLCVPIECVAQAALRRLIKPTPTTPRPSSESVAGSGTPAGATNCKSSRARTPSTTMWEMLLVPLNTEKLKKVPDAPEPSTDPQGGGVYHPSLWTQYATKLKLES
jgi:hypothetical protein